MSINTADPNLNQNQQPPITNQPQAHQMTHNYNNKHLNYSTGTYQQQQTVGSTPAGNQMTNLNSGLSSGQLAAVAAGKKTGTGQPASQFKSNQQQQFKVGQTNPNNNNNQSPGYRKVFIQRDYSEGTSVRFQNKFPEELEGYIERQHFDYLITTLNCYYDKAEAGNLSTFCEGFCACLTAYLIYVCMESHYEKYMRKTRDYINEQNEKVWRPRGLYVTDPIDRGLRILEITIGPKAQQREMVGNQFKQRDG